MNKSNANGWINGQLTDEDWCGPVVAHFAARRLLR